MHMVHWSDSDSNTVGDLAHLLHPDVVLTLNACCNAQASLHSLGILDAQIVCTMHTMLS